MASDKSLGELAARLDRIELALSHRIPHVFDPPPDDWGRWGPWLPWPRFPVPIPFPGPNPGDPAPIDLSRLSRAQLEVALENIKVQRIRLDAMETLINKQLKGAK